MGHTVLEAADGVAALEILRTTGDIGLLFTDVVMPGPYNGRDLAVAARRILPGLKVLFTSGYAAGRLSHEDLEEGHAAFIAKPFSRKGLSEALEGLFPADRLSFRIADGDLREI